MDRRLRIGMVVGGCALLLGAVQALAEYYSLYWRWEWFDNPVHFLGGFVGAAFAAWVYRFELPPQLRARVPRAVFIGAASFALYVSWEAFEYVTQSYSAINWLADTSLDLVMDCGGLILAYYAVARHE